MKILVTGALGFVGTHVSETLRQQGHDVIGVDIRDRPECNVHGANVLVPGSLDAVMTGVDAVVHCAALVSYAVTHQQAWDVNVRGTDNVLQAAEKAGVRRFVHVSSVVVYPDTGVEILDETYPMDTNGTPYVDTKVLSEIPVRDRMLSGSMECVIVRPGDIYGPGSRPWTALPYEAMRQRMFMLPRFGKGHFTPVFISDLVEGIRLCVETAGISGQIFNITDGTVVTCQKFFGLLRKYGDAPHFLSLPKAIVLALSYIPWWISKAAGKPSESNPDTIRYFCRETAGYSTGKAQKILGYAPQVDLEEGMKLAGEWCRETYSK